MYLLPKVFLACWLSSPVVRAFMERHNYTEIGQVEQHYVDEVLELADLTPIKYITWQDPADRGTKVGLVMIVLSVNYVVFFLLFSFHLIFFSFFCKFCKYVKRLEVIAFLKENLASGSLYCLGHFSFSLLRWPTRA